LSSKSTFSNSTSSSYALALYELAKENSEESKIEEEVVSIKNLIKENIEFKEIISNPTVAMEDKKKIILKISEQNNFSNIFKNFLAFVAVKNRLFFLDKIIESFLNLMSKTKGELKAKLTSSKKFSEKEKNKIQAELSENFKSKLNIEYKYDPELIAGLIVQVGSLMVDTSIKTKLKELEKSMIEV